MATDNLVELLISVVGAKAATDSLDQFTGKTNDMMGELTRLAGVTLTISAAIDGLKNTFDWGSKLQDLSARTGQTVADLVVIGRAFELAGMGADAAGQNINRLQRAIGGLNEMGQATGTAFASLGLDPNSLQGMTAVEQIDAITQGFQRIENPAQRSAIAMQLFGREGASMLALFQEGTLSQAATDAGRLADRMQENAERFDYVGDRLEVFGLRLREMSVVALEQLLPALERFGSFADSLNLSALGAGAASGAISGFGILLGNTVTTKLDDAVLDWATSNRSGNEFALRFLQPLSSGLRTLFQTALPGLIVVSIADAIASAISQSVIDDIRSRFAAQAAYGNATAAPLVGMNQAKTLEEFNAAKAQAQKLLDDAQKELTELEKGRQATDAYTGRISKVVDTAAVTQVQGRIRALQQAVDVEADPARLAANMASAIDRDLQPLVMRMTELRAARDKAIEESLSNEARATSLRNRASDLELALSTPRQDGISEEAWAAQRLEWETELLNSKTTLGNLEKQIASEAKRDRDETEAAAKRANDLAFQKYEVEQEILILRARATGDEVGERELTQALSLARNKRELIEAGINDVSLAEERVRLETILSDTERERLAMKEAADATYRQSQAEIADIQLRQQIAESAGTLSGPELWNLRNQALTEEIAKRRQNVAYLEQQAALASARGDSENFRGFSQMADSERGGMNSAEARRAQLGPDPNDFSAQWTRSLTSLRNQWQVTAQTISQSFEGVANGSLRTISQGITNIIMGTMTWNQALAMIGTTILTSIISAIVEMGVRWLAFEIMKAVLGPQLQAQAQAAMLAVSTPMAAAQSAIWAGPAALATIATLGGAALAAPAQVMGAKLATMGMAGFRVGGWSGDMAEDEVAGFAHGQEIIFSAPAVRELGKENLLALHQGALSSGSRSGQSALSTAVDRIGGGSRSRRTSSEAAQVVVVDDKKRGEAWHRKRRGPSKMIDLLERNGGL